MANIEQRLEKIEEFIFEKKEAEAKDKRIKFLEEHNNQMKRLLDDHQSMAHCVAVGLQRCDNEYLKIFKPENQEDPEIFKNSLERIQKELTEISHYVERIRKPR